MENYIIVMLIYIALFFIVMYFRMFHYQNKNNGNTKKKNPVNRGENYRQHNGTQRVYPQGSGKAVPPSHGTSKNAYKAFSITPPSTIPPIEMQIAIDEHNSWVEYLREDLGRDGITFTEIT